MASKKAKQKKVLDKAKQLVLKNKKGKAKAKPKQSYPEGQNAPQSKAYSIDNDKTQVAKRTGWRFTKEGAKKLGKNPSDTPTNAEIEKYRNQTFKVKGKVNKSGPSGSGDGSFRYIYIERRADKSDLKRTQKLSDGGYAKDEWSGSGKQMKLLVDSRHGVYVPQTFVEQYDLKKFGISDEDAKEYKQIFSNIENEAYWEAWEDLMNEAQTIDGETITQIDGDLWLVPEGYEYDDFYAKGGETKNAWGVFYNGKLMFTESSEESANKSAKMLKSEVDLPFAVSVEKIDDEEYAKGGKTKNLPTQKDVLNFQEYVFSFYGKGGLHADAFDGGVTTEEVLLATNQYLTFCARNTDLWGGGDTADREYVRDIMLYHRGVDIDDLFYSNLIKKIKKTTILEYGGILQPMIGGVNADPRFDIYNTTMFAEDGAMLELGGENPDEKLKVVIEVIVYEDDYEEGEGKLVNAYTVNWLKNPIVKADDLLEYLYDNLYLSRYPQDYAIDDNGIIHTSRLEDADGSEASESEIEKWKKGEMKLYSAHYSIIVEAVGQTRIPTQSELHEVTDIPMYEDGGYMAKGGETKIYDVTTRRKGENAMFSSSFRAKSKEDALRMYKERAKKYGDTRYEVVDVFETSRKRLEQGGENEQ